MKKAVLSIAFLLLILICSACDPNRYTYSIKT